SCSHFAAPVQRRSILLSAAKDVFATTRGIARCSRINPGSRRGHDARENALHYRLDAIREWKNTRRGFPRYAEAGAEHDLHALVLVSRNERDVPLPRYAAQSRGKNGHSQPGGGL